MLFEDTPLLAFERLGSLFVVASLNGIAHGRHYEILMKVDQSKRTGLRK